MGIKNNRECIICGRSYHYCPTCGADVGKPTWYAIFDGQNCHDIYEICVAYRDKEISIEDAYNKMSNLDLSYLDSIVPATKAQITEIMSFKKPKEDKSVEKKETNNTNINKK